MNSRHKQKLLRVLAELYPTPRSELDFKSEYQLVVAVILSAQCTDKKVNEITPLLFARFSDFKELAAARLGVLEQIIRPVNYYKTKAKHLKAMAVLVISTCGGRLPRSAAELRELPGVGPKTANVVLAEMGQAAFPVDTHVFRVARRLGLAEGDRPSLVEEELKAAFAPAQWRPLHHWLIFHGRRVCKAQRPLCAACPLAAICPGRKPAG